MEIERKWIVDPAEVPDEALAAGGEEIDQGYLAVEPEGVEVRLRRRDGSCRLTVKGAGGLSREEWEVGLDPAQFDALWPATQGRRLQKIRRLLELPTPPPIELDTYSGALDGLVVAEVEFTDEDAARAFEPPGWFGREVTGERAYRNQALAVAPAPPGAAGEG
jgi:adenylate cyclase